MNKIKLGGITIICLLFFLISCTDEPLQVGIELLPDSDLLTASADTLQVNGFTVKGYPEYTSYSNTKKNIMPLGIVNDPVFGTSTADLTVQLNFQEDAYYSFDENAVSDELKSIKLYFQIDQESTFGTDGSFDVNIYPLASSINFSNKRSSYKMKSEDIQIDKNLSNLTEHNIYRNNSKIADLDSGSYYLVIDLDTSYFSYLMDTTFIDENNLYSTQPNFTNVLPGMYINANITNSTGGIENINLESSYAILEYDRTYKDQNQIDSIITKYNSFAIEDYFGMYDHQSNYSPYGGSFGDFLGDTINIQDNFYIQSMGGVRGFIHLSELFDFREKNANEIGINLAEIVFPVDKDYIDTTTFYLPERLTVLEYIEGIKTGNPIIDDWPVNSQVSSPGYFIGFLDDETMEYRVNITEYAHRYMNNSSSTGWLYVLPSEENQNALTSPNYNSPARAIFSNTNSSNRPFVRIIYTYTNL
jgi:hypothetical protein